MPAASTYTGLSDFFQTPAGRALSMMSQPKPPAPADPRAAFAGGGRMRPSLANAIADAYGENLLRDFQSQQPYVVHHDANPNFAGTAFGGPRDEVYDPVADAPIVAGERQRRENFLNADSMLALSEIMGPRMAETNQQMADQAAEGDSYRWWKYGLPRAEQENRMAIDLNDAKGDTALLQRLLQNQGALDVANVRAGAARKDPTEVVGAVIANMSRSGAFGRDRQGHPLPPPPGAADEVLRGLTDLMQGGDAPAAPGQPAPAPAPMPAPGPAAAAPAVGGQKRISRANLERAVRDGHVASLDEAIRQAQAAGYVVY